MLDIKLIREKPDYVVKMVARKGYSLNPDRLLKLDECRRELQKQLEGLINIRKDLEKFFLSVKDSPEMLPLKEECIRLLKDCKENIKWHVTTIKDVDNEIYSIMVQIPNLPHESVPYPENQSIHTYIF